MDHVGFVGWSFGFQDEEAREKGGRGSGGCRGTGERRAEEKFPKMNSYLFFFKMDLIILNYSILLFETAAGIKKGPF